MTAVNVVEIMVSTKQFFNILSVKIERCLDSNKVIVLRSSNLPLDIRKIASRIGVLCVCNVCIYV